MAEVAVPSTSTLPLRARFNAWFVTHEVAWELLMAALAIVYVAIGFLADELPAGSGGEVSALELGLTLLFVVEFASRISLARDRLAYLRGHWIDVVALAPPIRGARVLRLLRLLRLVRAFAGLYRVGLHVRGLASHRGFAWLLVAWLGVMVLTSAGLYVAEHGADKSLVNNPFDALWWGVATLTTVGYGDVYPVTPEGRLAAIVLMVLGIGLFSAITATITSYMLSRNVEAEIKAEAVALAAQLERLEGLHDRGSLTDGEFARAKSRLLDVEVGRT